MASREILTFLTLIPARLNVRSNFIHCNSKKQRRSSPEVGEIRLKKNTPICFRFGRDALKTPVMRLRRLSINPTPNCCAIHLGWHEESRWTNACSWFHILDFLRVPLLTQSVGTRNKSGPGSSWLASREGAVTRFQGGSALAISYFSTKQNQNGRCFPLHAGIRTSRRGMTYRLRFLILIQMQPS